jgi:hypothetical protein
VDEGRQVAGGAASDVVDEHVPVRKGHGHEAEHLLAGVTHGHEQGRARGIRHPEVRFEHVRRGRGEVEPAFGQLLRVRAHRLDHDLEGVVAVPSGLMRSAGKEIPRVREVRPRVVGGEQHRRTDPSGGRRRTAGEPLRVVSMLLGTIGAEGHPETPTGDPRSGRNENRAFDLRQRHRLSSGAVAPCPARNVARGVRRGRRRRETRLGRSASKAPTRLASRTRVMVTVRLEHGLVQRSAMSAPLDSRRTPRPVIGYERREGAEAPGVGPHAESAGVWTLRIFRPGPARLPAFVLVSPRCRMRWS